MAAVAPVITTSGPLKIATWGPLDGGDTGTVVDVRGTNQIMVISSGTFADDDDVEVKGAGSNQGAPGTAEDWPDEFGQTISIIATEEIHRLKANNLEYLTLVVNAGGIAGPSSIFITVVALRTQDY